MRYLLALLPAAACAALMFICLRGMRHPEIQQAGSEERDELLVLRQEVALLREEVANLRAEPGRTGSVPVGRSDA